MVHWRGVTVADQNVRTGARIGQKRKILAPHDKRRFITPTAYGARSSSGLFCFSFGVYHHWIITQIVDRGRGAHHLGGAIGNLAQTALS